jgi:hypothetical protein
MENSERQSTASESKSDSTETKREGEGPSFAEFLLNV